jgi:hypothetical protein
VLRVNEVEQEDRAGIASDTCDAGAQPFGVSLREAVPDRCDDDLIRSRAQSFSGGPITRRDRTVRRRNEALYRIREFVALLSLAEFMGRFRVVID